MKVSKTLSGLAAILAVACGDGPAPGPPASRDVANFRVSSGGGTDTVGATATPLIVSATDAQGQPFAGAAVHVAVVADRSWPGEPSIALRGGSNDTLVAGTTSTSGTFRVDVVLGSRPGSFSVAVSVDRVLRADTVNYTVLAGQPVKLKVAASDTMTMVDVAYSPGVAITDRLGNKRNDAAVLSTTSSSCRVNGALMTGARVGRCTVNVSVGALVDSFKVTVVPNARVVAITGGLGLALATMNLDGTNYKPIRFLRGGAIDPMHPVRSSKGLYAVMDVGTDSKTHVQLIDSLGVSRTIPVDMPPGSEQNWPRFSPDGEWVYFAGCMPDGFPACRVWQARVDGSTPATVMTPAESWSGQRSTFHDLSPDGSTLIYMSVGGIQARTLASGASRVIARNMLRMAIDPSGTRLALMRNNDDRLQISNLDGTNVRTIAPETGFHDVLEWTPDGEWLMSYTWIPTSPTSAIGGPRSLVNVTTGEIVPLVYKLPVGEMTFLR